MTNQEWGKIVDRYIAEGRTVSGGKGDNSKAEMERANQLQAQELQLMQQQLQFQMNQINQVNAVIDPMIAQGGMAPSEESALTSIGINQLPQDFEQTRQSLSQSMLARGITGGNMAGAGAFAQGYEKLGAMEDFMKSQLLSNIQLQKANQQRQLLGMKMGIGGMFGQNVGVFNQGSLGALGLGVNAANNADQAQTAFLGSLLGAIGGIGSSLPIKPICWVARAVYGDWRAEYLRAKLLKASESSKWVRLFLAVYVAFGEQAAWLVKRSSTLRSLLKRILDPLLPVVNHG